MERNPEFENYLNTNNWYNYQKFYEFISKQKGFLRFAEVGVWKGHSTADLARKLIGMEVPFELFAIDSWDKNGHYPSTVTEFEKEHIQEIFTEFIKIQEVDKFITPMKSNSIEASKLFKKNYFDFILIDASHKEEDVINDIKAWWPKLRKNGIFACHDYVPWCGTKKAVDKMIEQGIIRGKKEIMNDMVYFLKS